MAVVQAELLPTGSWVLQPGGVPCPFHLVLEVFLGLTAFKRGGRYLFYSNHTHRGFCRMRKGYWILTAGNHTCHQVWIQLFTLYLGPAVLSLPLLGRPHSPEPHLSPSLLPLPLILYHDLGTWHCHWRRNLEAWLVGTAHNLSRRRFIQKEGKMYDKSYFVEEFFCLFVCFFFVFPLPIVFKSYLPMYIFPSESVVLFIFLQLLSLKRIVSRGRLFVSVDGYGKMQLAFATEWVGVC